MGNSPGRMIAARYSAIEIFLQIFKTNDVGREISSRQSIHMA
jgi:hypothetical protein